MRTSLIVAATAVSLAATPVFAQSPAARSNAPTGGPVTAAPRAPMPNPLTQEDVSRVKGSDVYGTDDKRLGSVGAVLMNPQSKAIDRLVVKSGGVLGVGGHDVAIPVDQFTWDTGREGFKLAKTADELKSMPEWKAASTGSSSSYGSAGSSTPTGAGSNTAR
jgi:sporulation protein YlmC with PRC-barrel domain